MKVYTCYFSGLGDRSGKAVSVCVQQPPGFKIPVADELAPPAGMYWQFLHGRLSFNRLKNLYERRLGFLDPKEIANRYAGMILVSFRGYDDKKRTKLRNDLRHIIADWLRKNGFECEELEPMSRRKKIL